MQIWKSPLCLTHLLRHITVTTIRKWHSFGTPQFHRQLLPYVQCHDITRTYSSKTSDTNEKKTKLLQFTSRISSHDLEVKIKKLSDLLHKGHAAKVTIKNVNPEDTKTPANLFKEVSLKVQELATVKQSNSSANEIVFLLKPIQDSTNVETTDKKLKPAKLHGPAKDKSEESTRT